MAATQGHASLAIGNAIGSNIANIGLVLGATALIAPLPVRKALAQREIPMLVGVSVLAGFCIYNGLLTELDSLALLGCLFITLYLMFYWQKKHPEDPLIEDDDDELPELSTNKAWFYLVSGLLVLLGSSQLLVWGATKLATLFGVSELVIGLTIVAIGTSLPELAASVASALKGHHDIALGNVVGSNIFNLLAVLPMPGLFASGGHQQSGDWTGLSGDDGRHSVPCDELHAWQTTEIAGPMDWTPTIGLLHHLYCLAVSSERLSHSKSTR